MKKKEMMTLEALKVESFITDVENPGKIFSRGSGDPNTADSRCGDYTIYS